MVRAVDVVIAIDDLPRLARAIGTRITVRTGVPVVTFESIRFEVAPGLRIAIVVGAGVVVLADQADADVLDTGVV